MAIDEKLDAKRYQGAKGKLRRLFETEVEDKKGRKQTLADATADDLICGLFWNPTKTEVNGVVSVVGGVGIAVSSMILGIMYGHSHDAVDMMQAELPIIQASGLSDFSAQNGATIISIDAEGLPYLIQRDEGRVFMFEPQERTVKHQDFRTSSDLPEQELWEWSLLSAPQAYDLLSQFDEAVDIYDDAQNEQQLGFLQNISPFTEYNASLLSPKYQEGDDVNITAAEYSAADIEFNIAYTDTVKMQIDSLMNDMRDGQYGFANEGVPEYRANDFDEMSLDRVSAGWFGTFLPYFFLMGAGMGSARAATRVVKTARQGGGARAARRKSYEP